MSSLLFLSPYKSRKRLWEEYHLLKKFPESINFAMQRGIEGEDAAIHHAYMNYPFPGYKFIRVGTALGPNNLTSCSPDAVLIRPSDGRITGIEVKIPLPHNIPDGKDEIPPHHLVQVTMCMHVLAAHDWHLFYFNPEKPEKSKMFRVTPNNEFGEVEEFFEEKVKIFQGMKEKEGMKRAEGWEKEKNWRFIRERVEITSI